MVLGFLGDPVDTGWGKLFDRGAGLVDATQYPTRDQIEGVMRDVSPRLNAKLTSLTDEVLTRPATMQVPGTKTVADELAFFAFHDSYHIGQLSYIRKSLGYPGLAGDEAVQAERVLDALGDPTRRLVFKRLRKGTRSVRELADGMDVSRPAVWPHLRVPQDAA